MLAAAFDRGEPFDVVGLDYNMPGTDGLTLAVNIRADERFSSVRLTLLTSSDVKPPSGIDGYLLKPVMRFGLARLLLRAMAVEPEPLTEEAQVAQAQVALDLRVLLAEDNPVNQKVAVRMLEKLGCRVDVASNGREALDMWAQFPYAAVFMDCQMPEMDGLEATRQIRSQESAASRARTPIVAMTANAMSQDREDCLEAGMDDYASKPIKLGLVKDLLERWVGQPPH